MLPKNDLPLSVNEVINIVGHPIKVLMFPQIEEIDDINDLFIDNCLLINYISSIEKRIEISPLTGKRIEVDIVSGHWCCLVRIPEKREIIYFNPTGRLIDESINFIPEEFRRYTRQYIPHLLKLLINQPGVKKRYKIRYMDKALQEPNTNTCGRWVGIFMKSIPYLLELNSLNGKSLEDNFINKFGKMNNKEIIRLTNLI